LFVGLFGFCFRSSLLDIASCKAQFRITIHREREREREREYREGSLVVFVFLFRKVVWCFQVLELFFGVDSGFCGVVCWVGGGMGVVVVLLEFFDVTEMDGE
jgi:hypothetical protein